MSENEVLYTSGHLGAVSPEVKSLVAMADLIACQLGELVSFHKDLKEMRCDTFSDQEKKNLSQVAKVLVSRCILAENLFTDLIVIHE